MLTLVMIKTFFFFFFFFFFGGGGGSGTREVGAVGKFRGAGFTINKAA